MAEVVRTTRKQALQMAGVIAGGVFTIDTAFWLLSSLYYKDKDPMQAAAIGSVRFAFATMSFVIAAMAYGAALAPRLIGHGLAALFGVASLVGGIAALGTPLPGVVGITLIVSGVVLPVLVIRSAQHSRPAWAFLIAVLSVFAAVTFFGAPKIRSVLHIGLWHALTIPGLQIVTVFALSMLRGEYRDDARIAAATA